MSGPSRLKHIGFIRTSNHQQNIDAISRKSTQIRRIGNLIQPAFHAEVLRDVTQLRIEERLPGPRKNIRIVATDVKGSSTAEPSTGIAPVEEGIKRGLPPPAQSIRTCSAFKVSG